MAYTACTHIQTYTYTYNPKQNKKTTKKQTLVKGGILGQREEGVETF